MCTFTCFCFKEILVNIIGNMCNKNADTACIFVEIKFDNNQSK